MSATRIQKATDIISDGRLVRYGASRVYEVFGVTGTYLTIAWPGALEELSDEDGARLCSCPANKVCCHSIAVKWADENGESSNS